MRCLAAIALILGAQSGAAAADGAVSCQTAGYDLIITNAGTRTLPEGTELAWTVRFARAEGVHVLDRPLEPGRWVILVAATDPSYLTTETPCTVVVR